MPEIENPTPPVTPPVDSGTSSAGLPSALPPVPPEPVHSPEPPTPPPVKPVPALEPPVIPPPIQPPPPATTGSASPAPEKPKSRAVKYIKWILIIIAILALAFFGLRAVGNLFIKEVTQNVQVPVYQGSSAADIGKQAPFFELADLDGNTVKLSDFLGSPLVVTFWTSWNNTSADQIKILDDYLATNKNSLFKIITVNSQEDESTVLNFIRRGGYQIKVLLDDKGKITELYKARSLPATYFLDRNGIIQDVFVGVLSREMLVNKSETIIH